ncbi:hypothetical protein BKA80DRAFT_283330 [Phyllosticta citrichinensis]
MRRKNSTTKPSLCCPGRRSIADWATFVMHLSSRHVKSIPDPRHLVSTVSLALLHCPFADHVPLGSSAQSCVSGPNFATHKSLQSRSLCIPVILFSLTVVVLLALPLFFLLALLLFIFLILHVYIFIPHAISLFSLLAAVILFVLLLVVVLAPHKRTQVRAKTAMEIVCSLLE